MSRLRIVRRKEDTTPTRKTILIVCEGERTEPDYFRKFRVAKKVEVCGTGSNTLSLVQEKPTTSVYKLVERLNKLADKYLL